MQGRRPKQEDRHVKIPDLAKAAKALKMPIDHLDQPCAFFAVYDGHQGHLCAEFAAKGFHMRLLKKLAGESRRDHWTDERVCSALKEVSEELDAEFLAKYRTAPDGCTCVVAFVTGNRLFTCWLGDSRCILCRESSQGGLVTVSLTEDHKPGTKSEAERVVKAGGVVVNFDGALRVAHQGFDDKIREIRRAKALGLGLVAKEPVALAVSRSLGDRDFKAVTGKELLTATPSTRCVQLTRSCRFIALMCDGVTDVMKNEEIVFELAWVRDEANPAANVRAVCGSLVQEAYKRGSQDNLTVIMVQFEWGEDVREAASTEDANAAKRRRVDGDAHYGDQGKPVDEVDAKGLAGKSLGPGRIHFRAQPFWQEILKEHVTQRGLETKVGMGEDRRSFARLPDAAAPSGALAELPAEDPRLLAAAMCTDEGREDEAEVAAALRRAAASGTDSRIKIRRLLASAFAPPRACGGALCEAAALENVEVISELLRARALVNAEEGKTGRTALHIACARGFEDVGRLLIAAGADLSLRDSAGKTPRDLAREQEFGMMVKRLEAVASEAFIAASTSPS